MYLVSKVELVMKNNKKHTKLEFLACIELF